MTSNRKSRFRQTLRKLLPDDPERLTFYSGFRAFLNMLDQPSRLLHPDLRDLPPNHLRCRVGAGCKRLPWANGPAFIERGYQFWLFVFSKGMATLNSDILEIGCGCGRNALILKRFRFLSERYSGDFIGIDIDSEAIDWCKRKIESENFRFDVSKHNSVFYNRNTEEYCTVAVPLADQSRDLVFANAVFGHLLQNEMKNYLSESARVLRPGGFLVFTFRCLDLLPDKFRQAFKPTETDALVIDAHRPEKSVAYPHASMVAMLQANGFHDIQIFPRDTPVQVLVARA